MENGKKHPAEPPGFQGSAGGPPVTGGAAVTSAPARPQARAIPYWRDVGARNAELAICHAELLTIVPAGNRTRIRGLGNLRSIR